MKIFYLTLMSILVVLAIFVVGSGLGSSSSAPQEAVVAGMGCFLAILARIAQAAAHNTK